MTKQYLHLPSFWNRHGSDSVNSLQNNIVPFYYVNEKEKIPRVERLREDHLTRLDETVAFAFKNDLLLNYLLDTPDAKKPSEPYRKLTRLLRGKYTKFTLKQKIAFTIDAGYSAIISAPPEKDVKRLNPIERVVQATLRSMLMFISKLGLSPEQCRRQQELSEKVKTLTDSHIPEDISKEMMYIELLATHPDYQGKGYATALLETILFSADVRGRSVYLHTGNPVNIGFYEQFGFVDVGEALLGTDNPTWDGPPVRVPLMIRKPKLPVKSDI